MKLAGVLAFVLVVAFAACRSDEPKTPPNSPLPEIDRTNEPKPSPLPFGDGGASSSK